MLNVTITPVRLALAKLDWESNATYFYELQNRKRDIEKNFLIYGEIWTLVIFIRIAIRENQYPFSPRKKPDKHDSEGSQLVVTS